MNNLKFSEVKKIVRASPGTYEIYTLEGLPIKVGIAKDLRKRLTAHGNSKQGRLKLKNEELGHTLENCESKQSILAKHLYFDSILTKKYDLKTEVRRVSFLENECFIKIHYTHTKNEAREIEREKELSGNYRYVGRVRQR